MSIYRVLACAVLVGALAMPGIGAPEAASKPKKAAKAAKVALKGEYATMAKVCELTPEQQEKVHEAVTAAATDFKAQEAEFQKKIEAAQKALRELQAQRPDRAKITAAKVDEVLTPEQKAKYVGYRLYVATSTKYAKLALTKEQKAALETACLAMGADPDGKTKADAKALELLTEEQKKKLEEMSKPKGKAAAKATAKATSKPASAPANPG